METKLKELIKEAVLEALAEVYAADAEVATSGTTDEDKDKKPGRPGPLIGPVGFSL